MNAKIANTRKGKERNMKMEYRAMIEGGQLGNMNGAVDADTMEDAWEMAREEVENWARDGEWGIEGASISILLTMDGADEWMTVVIPPDHDALIRAAGGDLGCDHDWTSEGEGGCDENPGVWSLGGTTLCLRSHCRICGLIREEIYRGTQRNPHEIDTVTYSIPDDED